MWRLYLLIEIVIVQTLSLASATEIVQQLQSETNLPPEDITNNFVDQPNDIGQKRVQWVVFTKKMTKKLRRTSFDNYTLNGNNISDELHVDEGWKSRIMQELQMQEQTITPLHLKQNLKNAKGSLTVLSTSATLNQRRDVRSNRTNVTCSFTDEYNCIIPVAERVIVPCWDAPHVLCIRFEIKYTSAVCKRTVRRCCTGYFLGSSGYCEFSIPAQPTVVTTTSCGGTITTSEGFLTSPKYPSNYDNNLNCAWTIRGPSGHKVVMQIVDIDAEDPVGACELSEWRCYNFCEYDSLEIHDVMSRKVRKLCGRRPPNSHFVSTGNTINIKFSSDVSTGGRGFKIAYAIVHESLMSAEGRRCVGGQTWQSCHRRCANSCSGRNNATVVPCFNSRSAVTGIKPLISVSRFDEITCVPGCACPPWKPFWHNHRCNKAEFCKDDYFKCGKPVVRTKLKIVGGAIAGRMAWPWMVQLETDLFSHICGATLICSNWVITAAHCFLNARGNGLDLDVRGYLVSVGKYWKHEQEDGRMIQIFEPQQIIVHPQYKVNSDTDIDIHDVALIRLPRAVAVTDYVRPACLPQPTISGILPKASAYSSIQQPTAGTICKVLGWGSTEGIGPKALKLKEASILIRPDKSCKYESYDSRLMICAGGHKDRDTCKGDSGGPLLCQRGRREWFLDGVTSFGDFCGKAGVAGGYVRISSYIDWIRRHVGNQCEK